ncbi:MAG: TraR/DksA family transcriptional regulator [Candidatus Eisenbacteria bacterium]|nr:TraR/DksA family transcriptional regulator [Candidatus Eisenbacteria bacterium]
MNKKDLKHFEKRLQVERDRLADSLGKLENSVLRHSQRESSGDLSAYSIHPADLGTDSMEREKDLQVASAEGRLLAEIKEAISRLEEGTYGVCESCGKEIDKRRLDVVPHVRYCLKCQEKEERRFAS